MACEIYYFETDSYGVSLYEEEVTTEPREGTTAVNNDAEAVRVEDLLNPVGDNNCEKKNGVARTPHGSGPREPWESVLPCPSKSYRKQYRFTHGQLRKLNRAFEKTHHPNDLQRKELARSIKVEEHTLKVWFNSQRTKYRKSQMALMKNTAPSSQNHIPSKFMK